MEFFQPHPVLIADLVVRTWVILPVIAALALLRLVGGRGGLTRTAAGLAAAVALFGVAARVLPGLTGGGPAAWLEIAAAANRFLGGHGLIVIAATLLAISAVMPGARWRWIDGIAVLAALGVAGLRIATRLI